MCVLFLDDSFDLSFFSHLLSLKKSMLISFPEVFGQLICGSTRQNTYFFTSKSGKLLETRLHIIRALNPRPEENFQNYKKLARKGFRIRGFWISHFILNLFDDNERLLRGQHYWKDKRPGDIKLSSDRQILIPKENKVHEFIKG